MKRKSITRLAVLVLSASQEFTIQIAAQEINAQHKREHPRYQLIDLGTLGGPHSYGSAGGNGNSLINRWGVVASFADTALPDPGAPNSCFDPDCFLAHAFRWEKGVKTDLGALPGANSAVTSINDRGWITGISQNGLLNRAVLWRNGQIKDLGTLGGEQSLGIYVNDAGQVIGISENGVPDAFSLFGLGDELRTFIWEDGFMRDIGTLGGPDAIPGASCSGQPPGIIVGQSYISFVPNSSTGIPILDAFLWKEGRMIDLGNLGGSISSAECANHRGQIIGSSTLPGDILTHAFFWQDGVMTDLGTLGGDNSEAIWLNALGEVVGFADLPGNELHDAVLWRRGKIHDLGTLPGDPCSRAEGLNSRGQVVGGSSDCHNFLHAFVWEEGGPMLDLNTLIPAGSGLQLTNAIDINDRGEIIARSVPLGVSPVDDEDLGHLVLLIPRRGQDDMKRKDPYSSPDFANADSSRRLSSVAKAASTSITSPVPITTARDKAIAYRTQLARQHHIPGVLPSKN